MIQIDEMIFNECKKTFMEQMKVHKRETAFAAILAYYFKPHEDHGLNDLFLKALFNKINSGNNFEWNNEKVSVKLEVPTQKGRIDILISSNKFVICIEFKINHELNNPLGDYVQYVNDKFKIDDSHKHFILLTPFKKEAREKAIGTLEFKEIILSELFQEVESTFKKREEVYSKNTKLQFYEDLVQTVKNRRIRSQRFNILNEIQTELSNKKIPSSFHNNNQGGFIEIKSSEFTTKLRVNQKGWQFEKWIDDKKFYTLEFNDNSDLDTTTKIAEKLIQFSKYNITSY